MVTIDRANTQSTEQPVPFYKQVAESSLMFPGGLIMLASATGLMMEVLHGTL